MLEHLHCTRYTSPRRARGQVLLLVLLLLTLGSGIFIFNAMSNASLNAASNNETALALMQAKDALIGWSAARGDTSSGIVTSSNNRPGEFPCPDTKAPTDPNYGTEDGSCTDGELGRVPWKTLGIPEPKDASGETLWYAVDRRFQRYSLNSAPITSDTMGTITVYSGSTATTVTTQAIAVIFAPGAALGSQIRDSTSSPCTTTGGSIANNRCADNYLESTSGAGSVNNAVNNGPFISASATDTFNDRILVITNADLMPVIEQRVAREMISILKQYKAADGDYPWADLADGNSNGSSGNYYNHPRFPCGTALPTDWGNGGTPNLPNWLTNGCGALTGWAGVIYYAVAKNRLEGGGTNCTTCTGSSLTLDGVSGTDLILLTPGGYTGSPARNWPSSFTTITGYFQDAQNADNTNDTFVTPSATTYNRDRIFKIP